MLKCPNILFLESHIYPCNFLESIKSLHVYIQIFVSFQLDYKTTTSSQYLDTCKGLRSKNMDGDIGSPYVLTRWVWKSIYNDSIAFY